VTFRSSITTSSTLGGTLSNKEINDLPLNGRNYENLLQLRPGVVRYPGGGFSTTSANGLRAEDNAYLVDVSVQQRALLSGQSIINGGRYRRRLGNDSSSGLHSGIQPAAKSSRGVRVEAWSYRQCRVEVWHEPASRYGLCIWTPTRRLDARNFFQSGRSSEKPAQPGAIWRNRRGRDHQGQIVLLRRNMRGQRYTVGKHKPVRHLGKRFRCPTPEIARSAAREIVPTAIPDAIADVFASGRTVSPVSLQIAGCTFTPRRNTVSCNGKGFPINNGTNPAGPTKITLRPANTGKRRQRDWESRFSAK